MHRLSKVGRTRLTASEHWAAIYIHSSHLEGGFSNFLSPLEVIGSTINQQEHGGCWRGPNSRTHLFTVSYSQSLLLYLSLGIKMDQLATHKRHCQDPLLFFLKSHWIWDQHGISWNLSELHNTTENHNDVSPRNWNSFQPFWGEKEVVMTHSTGNKRCCLHHLNMQHLFKY